MPELPVTPTETSIAQALEIAETGSHQALILDVDETSQNAVPKYLKVVNRLIKSIHPNIILPSYEDVLPTF